ncbi:unnamed protein product [Alternaria burnsii]|nr:unnamed protein product [Alternaria burnsii]
MSYELNAEDFADCADEVDDSTVTCMDPALETSAVGLSLCLVQNDGILKVTLEGGHGGSVDWVFQGLKDLNKGSTMACAITQTDLEVPLCNECVGFVPPKLSVSTVQTSSINPSADHIVQPPLSGLSTISTTETYPTEPVSRYKHSVAELRIESPTSEKETELKRKATSDVERVLLHKRAKSLHNSQPWPNHLYMTCIRTQPISKSDIGTLHIDLVKGTAWFESWHEKENTRVFEKKQIDMHCPSTSIHYLPYGTTKGTDGSTHYLNIGRLNTRDEWTAVFKADCSAPGWQIWGSDTDTSPGPNPTLADKEWIEVRRYRMISKIPCPQPTWISTHISPSNIVDALVHCVDRASQRQAIHDPEGDHELQEHLNQFRALNATESLTANDMDEWKSTREQVKTRKALRRKFRIVE